LKKAKKKKKQSSLLKNTLEEGKGGPVGCPFFILGIVKIRSFGFGDSPTEECCIIFLEDLMQKLDLKKTLKPFYDAKLTPAYIQVPAMNFLMINGIGNPNTSKEYSDAVQALYSTAYTLKFKLKKEQGIDYPVMPLEGLWWTDDMALFTVENKDAWLWTMMISIPEFIPAELVDVARDEAARKKDLPALPRLRLERFAEGLAAQLMHIGPYSAEADNIQRLHAFIQSKGHSFDGLEQKHHEIYLSDPRKSAPEKLKTIIRQPVKEHS
jgi:hypothetical protein